ncbi:hypothetical protein J2787_004422 [Chryseobacterium rhizosphaerae]|uniref:RHS repeat protein n=1 Tax=Chryseobacterium rhizosphaerae TaxID=395937 RepID=A0AAE3YEZ0_9FLAO|nr:hypothetical protein [Chryseobacterium rhizosphaerae]MDR6528981.1 hypothetical protein [Chryseobacterium rhizosphaerae]
MIKKYITLSTLALSPYLAIAQVNKAKPFSPDVFSNSPIAASLGQFNPFEADLFSGQSNINFNLFNFSKEGYNLNIDLSYNLASVKPDTPPTWAGTGWNINVGGVITRTVKGGVDEILMGNNPPADRFSYYDHYNILENSDWDSGTRRSQFIAENRSIGPTTLGTANPAPDEFNFNVNGMSGSFYKNHQGNWIVASGDFKDIKVLSELANDFGVYENGYYSSNNKTHNIKRIIYGFTLTDQNGIKYIFGQTPESIEFTSNPQSNTIDPYNSHFIANSWFLTKVILPSNFEIIYSYERENKAFFKMHYTFGSIYYKINSGVTEKEEQKITQSPERTFVTYLKNININNLYSIDFYKSIANVEQYNFSNISNAQWNTSFGYDHHFRSGIIAAKQFNKLDKITVKKNSIVEEINFSYLQDPTKKLYMTGFNQNGKSYQLEYYSTDLPKFNQMKNDHWGYFNNKSFLTSVTPANGVYYSVDQLKNVLSAYKETDPSQLTKGVLKKIIFPTKGFSEFIYEPHDYNKVIEGQNTPPFDFYIENTAKKIAGGLRLKKMITDPGDAQNIVKEYFYTEDGTATGNSTGVLSGKPVYFEEDQNNGARIYRFVDLPIIPTNNTRGKHVVYSKVTERISENGTGGSTEYIFSNSDNGYIDRHANGFTFYAFSSASIYNNLRQVGYNSIEFERGKPLSIIKKDQNNNIVQRTNYSYNNAANRFDNIIRAYDFQSNVYGEAIEYGAFTLLHGVAELIRMSAHNIYSYLPYLSQKEEITYKNNNPELIQTTNYTYNSGLHNQLTQTEFKESAGTINTTLYKYAHEKGNQKLINANMIGIPLETTVTKKQNVTDLTGKIISKNETKYDNPNNLFPSSILTSDLQNSSPVTEVTFDQYDSNGNLQQYTTKNGVSTVIIWGYNNTQPIAKIEGVTYAQVSSAVSVIVNASDVDGAAGTNNDETALLTAFKTFRAQFPNSPVTTYTYDPLVGVRSIIPPSGIGESYLYDAVGRLEKIVDVNGKVIKEMKYNYKN